MIMGEGLENMVGSHAGSMSKCEMAALELLDRLVEYSPRAIGLQKLRGGGAELLAMLYLPVDPNKREDYIHRGGNGEEPIFCGARYFCEVIARNGVWSNIASNFDQVLVAHRIRKGHLGCYDGKVGATEDESVIAAPIKFRIGRLPNAATVGALEGTYHAHSN